MEMALYPFLPGCLTLLGYAAAIITPAIVAGCGTEKYTRRQDAEDLKLRHLKEGEEYRTPRAGEGFRTTVLGRDVTVCARCTALRR